MSLSSLPLTSKTYTRFKRYEKNHIPNLCPSFSSHCPSLSSSCWPRACTFRGREGRTGGWRRQLEGPCHFQGMYQQQLAWQTLRHQAYAYTIPHMIIQVEIKR